MVSVLGSRPTLRTAWATARNCPSSSCHGSSPYTWGQKYDRFRNAAEWKVRAWTGPVPASAMPSAASLIRSSPAARAVNVTARTWSPRT